MRVWGEDKVAENIVIRRAVIPRINEGNDMGGLTKDGDEWDGLDLNMAI